MGKLSEEQLNKLISYWDEGKRYGRTEEILSCLIELKQLRDEKKRVKIKDGWFCIECGDKD